MEASQETGETAIRLNKVMPVFPQYGLSCVGIIAIAAAPQAVSQAHKSESFGCWVQPSALHFISFSKAFIKYFEV